MDWLLIAVLAIAIVKVWAAPTKESRTMSKFGYLKKLEIDPQRTAELVIGQLKGQPTLVLVCAGEENRGYANAVLRADSKRATTGTREKERNMDDVRKDRDDDRPLYARYIIKDWRGVEDSDGNDVEFSQDNAAEFFEAIPPRIFNEIRIFATDVNNFTDEVIDVEAVSGN